MNKTIITLCLTIWINSAYCQKKISINLNSSMHYLMKAYDNNYNLLNQYGFGIDYDFKKTNQLSFSNYTWTVGMLPTFSSFGFKGGSHIMNNFLDLDSSSNFKIKGKITGLSKFKFYDLNYGKIIQYKRFEIVPNIGLSICVGKLNIFDSIIINNQPGFDDAEIFTHFENTSKIGGIFSSKFKYKLKKNIYLNSQFQIRSYPDIKLTQFEFIWGLTYKINLD